MVRDEPQHITREELQRIVDWLRENSMRFDGMLDVKVDASAYTRAGVEWAAVEGVAPGTASVYPVKVRLSNGAPGQFKVSECLEARVGRVMPELPTLLELATGTRTWGDHIR